MDVSKIQGPGESPARAALEQIRLMALAGEFGIADVAAKAISAMDAEPVRRIDPVTYAAVHAVAAYIGPKCVANLNSAIFEAERAK